MAEKTYRVLNLGAGVQSTALYVLSMRQDEPDHVPPFDVAIFADVQDEPSADVQDEPSAVTSHLEWLKSLGGPPILTVTAGRIGDDIINGVNTTGQDCVRYASIPAFVRMPDGRVGIMKRQCTSEYKIKPIERAIRREVVGLDPGRPLPRDVEVIHYMGLSFEEGRRIVRVQDRYRARRGWSCSFPLWDLQWRRSDCLAYLRDVHPGRVIPRSACVFCPYRSNKEWRAIRDQPAEWARACEVDASLRSGRRTVGHMDGVIYLHRSCKPLTEAPIDEPDGLFAGVENMECEGVCGT